MTIDLNADVGEGFGSWRNPEDDPRLLAAITSANVACGFHAGDPSIMRETVAACVRAGVGVGAHPGYPDLRGFGRVPLALPGERVLDDVVYQVGALQALARLEGARVLHVKPHGAMYEAVALDPALALALADRLLLLDPALRLVVPTGSVAAHALAARGRPVVREGFADRAYRDDGLLAPRNRPGAVLTDPEAALRQAVALARGEEFSTLDGATLQLEVDTICLHSDTPGAAELARHVRDGLEALGFEVRNPHR